MTNKNQNPVEVLSAQVPAEIPMAVEQVELIKKEIEIYEEYIASGECVKDLFIDGVENKRAPADIATEFRICWRKSKQLIEEYNVRVREAKNALRSSVQISATQWRGPEGRADVLQVGPFQVTSVTRRTFDPDTLIKLIEKHGLLDELLELKTYDKDGKEVPMLKKSWKVDYQGILQWLRAKNLSDVIIGSYDEKESTPAVKGPKELSQYAEVKNSTKPEDP